MLSNWPILDIEHNKELTFERVQGLVTSISICDLSSLY